MSIVIRVCMTSNYWSEFGANGPAAAEFIMSGTDEGIQGRLKGKSIVTKELIEKSKLQEEMLPVAGGSEKIKQRQ